MISTLRNKCSTSVNGNHQFLETTMEDIEEDITDEELLGNVEHLERTAQQEGGGEETPIVKDNSSSS